MGGNLWRESAANQLADRQSYFKRYLYRNYRTFAAITHRFGRRVTLTGWLVLAGTVAAAALGADTNASLELSDFRRAGLRGHWPPPFARLWAGPVWRWSGCCPSSDRSASRCAIASACAIWGGARRRR